jgi:hypothetical protein
LTNKALLIKKNCISAIFDLDCPAGLGIFRGNSPLLTLGGSKVNIKGNFKGKVRKCHVPYLRLTPQLIRCLDFTPFEEGGGVRGEERIPR